MTIITTNQSKTAICYAKELAMQIFIAGVFNVSMAQRVTNLVIVSFRAPRVNFGFHYPLVSLSGLRATHLAHN